MDEDSKQWLIDHNGEALPSDVVTTILAAGGPAMSDVWWSHEDGSINLHLPDDAIDWVEATANDETD